MSIIKCEKTEKSAFALEFSVDKATFEAAVNKVYRQQVKNINIPGFRKGKAPRSIVERMYGKGVFYEDAANELLPAAYALAGKQIAPEQFADLILASIQSQNLLSAETVQKLRDALIAVAEDMRKADGEEKEERGQTLSG